MQARRSEKTHVVWAEGLGKRIGEALAGGIAEGLRGALASLDAELAPLGRDLAELVRAQVAATTAPDEGIRLCADPGCTRRAIARGLCRRHYARQAYREKKERQGGTVAARPARAARPSAAPAPAPAPRKPVAPVAPIIRRKKADEAAAAPAPAPRATEPAPALSASAAARAPVAVVPSPKAEIADAVARFFGVKG